MIANCTFRWSFLHSSLSLRYIERIEGYGRNTEEEFCRLGHLWWVIAKALLFAIFILGQQVRQRFFSTTATLDDATELMQIFQSMILKIRLDGAEFDFSNLLASHFERGDLVRSEKVAQQAKLDSDPTISGRVLVDGGPRHLRRRELSRLARIWRLHKEASVRCLRSCAHFHNLHFQFVSD